MVGIDRVMSEGRALTNCIGNGVATMVIAKWQGELDSERFQAALDDPSIADPVLGLIATETEVPVTERFRRPAEPVPALT